MAPMRQDVKASAVKYRQDGRSIVEIQNFLEHIMDVKFLEKDFINFCSMGA